MKLLIVTQKVNSNDDALGFFTRWIDEFSRYYEHVHVICLEQGMYSPPENVTIHSLGKENRQSRLKYIARFYDFLWNLRREYDAVFVHMNPMYVVLGSIFWKLQNKKISLWYTHRHVDTKLRLAEKLTDVIFTAAPESFQLQSKKINVVGHGIDVERFRCKDRRLHDSLRIVSVGRITQIKHCDLLIRAAALLKQGMIKPFTVEFVGRPVTAEDQAYFTSLKKLVEDLELTDIVSFVGSVPNHQIQDIYCQSTITVNMVPTGGIDKAVLESMAAGVLPLTSNRAFINYFDEYSPILVFDGNSEEDLAHKIHDLYILPDSQKMALTVFLQQAAQRHASIHELIPKLVEKINS